MGKNKIVHKATKFEEHVSKIGKIPKARKPQTQVKQKTDIQHEVSRKKNLFALSDDEDLQDLKLTHNGQELKDDYNDMEFLSSGDEQFPKGFVKDNHFVGFDKKKDHETKSKKEIYEDIIHQSKQRKIDKLKQKEENIAKIEQLNNVIPAILEILPLKQKSVTQKDQDYLQLYQSFKMEPKIQIEDTHVQSEKTQQSLNKQRRDKIRQQKLEQAKQQIDSDDENNQSDDDKSQENDDQVMKQVKNTRDKKILKNYKKVQHLSNVMDHLRKVQQKTQDDDEEEDELDQIEDSGDEDDQDEYDIDNEFEGDENSGDQDVADGQQQDDEGDDNDDDEDLDQDGEDDDDEDEEEEEIIEPKQIKKVRRQ